MRYAIIASLALLTACGQSSQAPTEAALADVDVTPMQLPVDVPPLSVREIPSEADFKIAKTTRSFKGYLTWGDEWRKQYGHSSSSVGGGLGPKSLCVAMKQVGLGCSYNERGALADYIAANGKNLFPCGDGSNPYYNTKADCDLSSIEHQLTRSYYIGQPGQSATLERSIRKNAKLFKNGDLQPQDAARWEL